MEIRWNSRRKESMKRLVCPLLSFVLAVGLIVAAPGLSGEAKAVNLGEECSLTISPGSSEFTDLSEANVVVDLYKVADAEEVSGYDTYTYTFGESYNELQDIYNEKDNNPDNAAWKQMAQAAAQVVLGDGSSVEPTTKGASVNVEVEGLTAGLYLLIARGSDVTDYKTTVTTDEGTQTIATIANSPTHVYTFAPELISLPGKEGNTTAGNGEWIYKMPVTLKPEQSPRYGSLEIIKNLDTYKEGDPAVFVFQVEGMLDGKNVYSNVATLQFTEPGQKKALIDKIPVGATVTVTEVYSGASYTIESADVPGENETISAEEVLSATFTNDYHTTTHGGGGVNNHFTYDTQTGWQWDQQPSNQE